MELKKNGTALVSIALCTYNGETNLACQLNTLVQQTYRNKEIIIVDDCSSDATIEILEQYRLQFPFIKLFRNDENLGYIKNFEKAISLCNGEYIALADQDDIWDLNKIQLMIEHIGSAALIYHDSFLIDKNGKDFNKKMSDVISIYEGKLPHFFIFNNSVSGHSLLFRKALLKDLIPFDTRYFHDKMISLVASERGGIKFLDIPLVKYRQHSDSITDVLGLKAKKEPERLFSRAVYDWLVICKDKSLHYKDYFESILQCFDENLSIKHRYKLFYLLARKRDLIFYNQKKSSLSRLNFVRKICFLHSHHAYDSA